jgi:dihydroceramidase
MQLVDELSMIYTTCLMVYACFSYSRGTVYRIALAISLVALSLFITLYYHYLQDPAFHQNTYALLTTIVVLRTMFTMEHTLRPSLRRHKLQKVSTNLAEKRNQAQSDIRDKAILKNMWVLVGFGLIMFLGGFGIWSLDNMYCSTLRVWRREIGLPWGVLLEGHGWW